jgi:alkylhydroperoxidase/carboxymuconolactone decarboxylase family protein YurZ
MKRYRYPRSIKSFKTFSPKAWEAYDMLEDACYDGPLGEKTCRLIKMAVTASALMERSTKVHVQLALEAGASEEEIRQAMLMILTSRGFPGTVIGLQWADEVIAEKRPKKRARPKG